MPIDSTLRFSGGRGFASPSIQFSTTCTRLPACLLLETPSLTSDIFLRTSVFLLLFFIYLNFLSSSLDSLPNSNLRQLDWSSCRFLQVPNDHFLRCLGLLRHWNSGGYVKGKNETWWCLDIAVDSQFGKFLWFGREEVSRSTSWSFSVHRQPAKGWKVFGSPYSQRDCQQNGRDRSNGSDDKWTTCCSFWRWTAASRRRLFQSGSKHTKVFFEIEGSPHGKQPCYASLYVNGSTKKLYPLQRARTLSP